MLLTIGFGVVRCRNHEYMNPEWEDPHDWSQGKESLQICPKCERTARPEYLRLVNSIFDPKHFRVCKDFKSIKLILRHFHDFFPLEFSFLKKCE